MYIEIRTYRLQNGTVPQYLKVMGDIGIAIQKKHLGDLIGYFSSEIGPISEIVHIWGFDSLDDRQERRARLAADPEWQAFLPKIHDLIVTAENKIMKPASFSPVGGTNPTS